VLGSISPDASEFHEIPPFRPASVPESKKSGRAWGQKPRLVVCPESQAKKPNRPPRAVEGLPRSIQCPANGPGADLPCFRPPPGTESQLSRDEGLVVPQISNWRPKKDSGSPWGRQNRFLERKHKLGIGKSSKSPNRERRPIGGPRP